MDKVEPEMTGITVKWRVDGNLSRPAMAEKNELVGTGMSRDAE